MKFEGEDIASELGGAALESTVVQQLEKAYALAGIESGAGSFTFEQSDNTFTALLGKHELAGTYEYDASTHVITLRFAAGKLNLGAVDGHAYVSGSDLLKDSESGSGGFGGDSGESRKNFSKKFQKNFHDGFTANPSFFITDFQ